MKLDNNALKISALITLTIIFLSFAPAAFSALAASNNAIFKIEPAVIAARPGESVEITIQTDITHPFHLYAPGDKTGIALSYSVESPALDSFFASYPAPAVKDYPALGEKLLLYEGVIYSTLEVKIAAAASAGRINLPVKVSYQACTDTICTPPAFETLEAALEIISNITAPAAGAPGIAAPEKSAQNTAASSSADADGKAEPKKQSSFSQFYEKSIFLAIAMAFIWGLISSLTPCVYPMIPITVAFFGSQAADGSRKKTFALALTFTVGMAISFAALGVIVTFIGVDPGSIMSNAWVVAALTFLLLFFAGALFEFYEIKMPDSIMAKLGQSEPGYFGAFSMGLTMGLVAAPCVGPFAGSLLIFVSAVNSAAIGFLMLFSYGMGLGMLFLAVAMGAKFLPKSGMWMIRLKNFFGLVILWLTLYFMQFVTPLYLMLGAASFYSVVTASILGIFSTVDENTPLVNHFAKGAGVVCLALAALFAFMAVLESGAAPAYTPGRLLLAARPADEINQPKDSWLDNYEEGMKKARAENKPVIIDFYADWCLPCRQIEAQIFKNSEFIAASSRFIKIKLDCTQPSNEGAVIKNKKYNSPYMPYIIFYDSKGEKSGIEVRGYTSLAEMLETISKIK
jgi:thiol:disulfide interchange protein DsbD